MTKWLKERHTERKETGRKRHRQRKGTDVESETEPQRARDTETREEDKGADRSSGRQRDSTVPRREREAKCSEMEDSKGREGGEGSAVCLQKSWAGGEAGRQPRLCWRQSLSTLIGGGAGLVVPVRVGRPARAAAAANQLCAGASWLSGGPPSSSGDGVRADNHLWVLKIPEGVAPPALELSRCSGA